MVTSSLKRFSNQVGFLTKPTLTETRDEAVLNVAVFATVSVFWILKKYPLGCCRQNLRSKSTGKATCAAMECILKLGNKFDLT